VLTLFILVRHGQTDWNTADRFRGRADLALNETGLFQAAAAGRRIAAQWQPATVYSSPMRRALQTAQAIAGPLGLKVQPHSGLADIDFGQWQGLTTTEARERWPEMAEAWFNAPQIARPPGGETLAEVRARAAGMLEELAGRHPGQTAVLVGHTVINRVILLAALGLGNERLWRLGQETTAINVFESLDGEFNVHLLNDTCHLRG